MNYKKDRAYYDQFIKPEELVIEHFIERLFERYELKMTEDEYLDVNQNSKFHFLFNKMSGHKQVVLVEFKGTPVWCLRDNKRQRLETAYPPAVDTNIHMAIKSCFGRGLRNIAADIYEHIKEVEDASRTNFTNITEAAPYYFQNSPIPILLINKFKYGKITNWQYCNEIKRVIETTHLRIGFSFKEKGQPWELLKPDRK